MTNKTLERLETTGVVLLVLTLTAIAAMLAFSKGGNEWTPESLIIFMTAVLPLGALTFGVKAVIVGEYQRRGTKERQLEDWRAGKP